MTSLIIVYCLWSGLAEHHGCVQCSFHQTWNSLASTFLWSVASGAIIISLAWASGGLTQSLYTAHTTSTSYRQCFYSLILLDTESIVSETSGFHDWSLHNRGCALVFLYVTSF